MTQEETRETEDRDPGGGSLWMAKEESRQPHKSSRSMSAHEFTVSASVCIFLTNADLSDQFGSKSKRGNIKCYNRVCI